VPSPKRSGTNKRALLAAWVEERRPERIGLDEFRELAARLAPVAESYLRRLVRECGIPLDPLVEGVRQSSFGELERTLLALAAVDRAAARRLVIQAKDHARLASRRLAGSERADREEMILWMLTWLENPDAFPVWLRLRKKAAGMAG